MSMQGRFFGRTLKVENRKSRISVLVAAAVIVAWLIVPTEAGQKIQYKLNLRKGQSYYVRVISDSNVAQEMMGQKNVVEVTAGFGYRFDVKEVDEKGNGWVDCTFDWVKFRQKAPMMDVAYDSANKGSPVPAGAQGVAVFLGAGFSAKITPQGQVQEVKATEQLRKNIEAQLPEGPERKQMLDAFEKQQLAESIKELCLSPMAVYPDKPVGIGDSWSRTVSFRTQPLIFDNKWTLKDRKAGTAIIEAATGVKSNPEALQDAAVKMKLEMSGKRLGQIEIRESTGQIMRSKITQDLSGQMQTGAATVSVKTHGINTFEMTERGK
jgi:hypothetical protein